MLRKPTTRYVSKVSNELPSIRRKLVILQSSAGGEDMCDDPSEMIHLKIRNFGDFLTISEKSTLASTKSTTKISEFLKHISTKLQIPTEEVELVYQEKCTGNIVMFKT